MRYDCITPSEAKVMYANARYKVAMIGILADLMDGSKEEVCNLLGVPLRKGERKGMVNPDRVRSMYESGIRTQDIANEFGVKKETIRYWIKKLQLKRAS